MEKQINNISRYWQIIVAITALIVGWTTMNNQIKANAKEIDRLTGVIERIIVLEEQNKIIKEDINEIKLDIKEIKNRL